MDEAQKTASWIPAITLSLLICFILFPVVIFLLNEPLGLSYAIALTYYNYAHYFAVFNVFIWTFLLPLPLIIIFLMGRLIYKRIDHLPTTCAVYLMIGLMGGISILCSIPGLFFEFSVPHTSRFDDKNYFVTTLVDNQGHLYTLYRCDFLIFGCEVIYESSPYVSTNNSSLSAKEKTLFLKIGDSIVYEEAKD